jgi:uncharacterized protein YyaL (SSP411 family)
VAGHPYFQSRPIWQASLAEGLREASAQGKRVFLTIGRIDCGGSRALVEKTISKEEIFEYLVERFTCVALDADALPDDASGALVLDTAGGRPAAVFLNDLVEGATRRVVV